MRTSFVTKLASAVASISLFALASGSAQAAGTASFSLNGGTYQQGATFTATIRETSTEGVGGVEASLAYDATKLECLGISGAGSAFAQEWPGNACGGGTVTVNRTVAFGSAAVTGTQTVATVTFRALAGSGSATVNFGANSKIVDANGANVWNGNTAGASYAFTAAPGSNPTPAPTSAPKPTTSASKPATSTTANTPTGQNRVALTGVMASATEAETTPAPATEATPSPTPMEGQAEAEPTVVPAPSETDTTSAVSGTTIWSIIAVIAAGATALYVVRRIRANK